MKQRILVATGLFILVGVCALWVYLLMFGVPKSPRDVAADFGFPIANDTPTERPAIATQTTERQTIDTQSSALVQLTTRPVAGWQSIHTSDTTTNIVYAEQGTGHIYNIDLTSGTETRTDATTVANTSAVYFSPDAQAAVFVADRDGSTHISIRSISLDQSNNSYIDTELPPGAENISFSNNTTIHYTYSDEEGTKGYIYDISTKTQRVSFEVPFQSVTVVWGENNTYLYNKPSPYLKGNFYRVAGSTLTSLLAPAYDLTVASTQDAHALIYSYANPSTDSLETKLYAPNNTQELATVLIPEKCVFAHTYDDIAWCGSSLKKNYGRDAINDWYKGTTQFEDSLWEVNLSTGEILRTADLTKLSGRAIDIDKISAGDSDMKIFFRNKINNTLWLYNLRS